MLTVLAAFFIALGVGCATHYEKIVRNEFYGYPDVGYINFNEFVSSIICKPNLVHRNGSQV